jgi:sucrose-6-phosphate hydrolase SacC (GH32 family)
VQFHGSADLKRWQLLGTFGQGKGAHDGNWECPDLFPLRVAFDVARVQPGLVQVGQQAVASLITSDKRRQADGCNETGKSQRHIQRRTAGARPSLRTSQRASPKHRIDRVWLVAGGLPPGSLTPGNAPRRRGFIATKSFCSAKKGITGEINYNKG